MSEPIVNVTDAVRVLGALPMPVGAEPQLTPERLAQIRSMDLLAMMPEWSAAVVSGHLAALLARIAELEAERRTTNESLDDAVQELRERREDGVYPQGTAQRVQQRDADDVTPQVRKLRSLLAGQRLVADDPNGLHHDYRLGRDLPAMGGA